MTTLYFPSSGNSVIKDFNPIPTKASKFGHWVKWKKNSFHPFKQSPKSLHGSNISGMNIQSQFLTLCFHSREWFYSIPLYWREISSFSEKPQNAAKPSWQLDRQHGTIPSRGRCRGLPGAGAAQNSIFDISAWWVMAWSDAGRAPWWLQDLRETNTRGCRGRGCTWRKTCWFLQPWLHHRVLSAPFAQGTVCTLLLEALYWAEEFV